MTTLSISRGSHRSAVAVLILTLMCSTTHAADAVVYKWVDKNGGISYSQFRPAKEYAHDVTALQVDAMTPTQRRATARMLANLDKSTNAEYTARQTRLKKADARVDAALRNLVEAEHRLSEGSTPTGDDRVGNVGGHARLRDSYFNRVSGLQAQVDQAQQEVNEAYAARDQL